MVSITWPISSYPCDVTEHEIGKRCTKIYYYITFSLYIKIDANNLKSIVNSKTL